MTYPTDNYAHLIVQGMGGEAEHVKTGTGILTSWNPSTFENTVRHRGTDFHDLPVLSRVEALGFHTGQVVLLEKRRQAKNGLYQYAIKSAPLAPGPGAAAGAAATIEAIVEQIAPTVVEQAAPAVFADRVHADSITASQSTTSTSFTDLGTVGPQVTSVDVQIGRLLVWLGAQINGGDFADDFGSPAMSAEIDGPTGFEPGDLFPLGMGITRADGGNPIRIAIRTSLFYDLDVQPGSYTLTAKYRSANGQPVTFLQRSMMVIAL